MKVKLLYITNSIKGAAGLERVLSIKANYLADNLDYEVHILTLNQNNDSVFYNFSSNIIFHDIAVFGNPLQYIFQYIKGIKNCITEINPDIISVCDDGLKGFFIPVLLKNKCSIIYERHVSKIIELGENPTFSKKIIVNLKFKLMHYLAKGFKKFIVLTKENTNEWDLKNIMVISNPLSFYPNHSSDLNQKKVISVGKQSFQKGFDRLLHSWRFVQQQFPEWKLEIYGKYDSNQKLSEISEELGISNSVNFYEPVNDIESKYLESSIFAFSSRFEGFGMVLTEAMACGVPCVSFDCPYGPGDIISNNEDGFLVENGDVRQFAEKLIKLIEDDQLRFQFGKSARENVKRYSTEIIMSQWDKLFKQLVDENNF